MNAVSEQKKRIIVIVGPTASGKSALGELLLQKFGGTIVNADSRQVYSGLPTLTAAASTDASHKLYQFLSLDEGYSFPSYVAAADTAIAAATNPVFVIGGTGLYIDALVRSAAAAPVVSTDVREKVSAMNAHETCAELLRLDPVAAARIDIKNPRRVSRALEIVLATGKSITEFGEKSDSPYEVLWIGWNPGRDDLQARIRTRIIDSWSEMVGEVSRALENFSPDAPGLQTIGVPEISAFLAGEISQDAAQELLQIHTAQYAKRQMTWFKRNKNIVWYTNQDEVCQSLHDFLHNDLQKF